MNVIYAECSKQVPNAECRYAECRYADCRDTVVMTKLARFALKKKFSWRLSKFERKFTAVGQFAFEQLQRLDEHVDVGRSWLRRQCRRRRRRRPGGNVIKRFSSSSLTLRTL